MFQSLRPNSPVYVLHKGDNPRLDMGTVSGQPLVKPKYQVPTAFGQPQEMVVDITVSIQDRTCNFNGVPANLDVADLYFNGEGVILSDSREAMNAELASLRQRSVDVIDSVERHRGLLGRYDSMIAELNPEYAEKQAQRDEITRLNTKVDELSRSLGLLLERLSLKQE